MSSFDARSDDEGDASADVQFIVGSLSNHTAEESAMGVRTIITRPHTVPAIGTPCRQPSKGTDRTAQTPRSSVASSRAAVHGSLAFAQMHEGDGVHGHGGASFDSLLQKLAEAHQVALELQRQAAGVGNKAPIKPKAPKLARARTWDSLPSPAAGSHRECNAAGHFALPGCWDNYCPRCESGGWADPILEPVPLKKKVKNFSAGAWPITTCPKTTNGSERGPSCSGGLRPKMPIQRKSPRPSARAPNGYSRRDADQRHKTENRLLERRRSCSPLRAPSVHRELSPARSEPSKNTIDCTDVAAIKAQMLSTATPRFGDSHGVAESLVGASSASAGGTTGATPPGAGGGTPPGPAPPEGSPPRLPEASVPQSPPEASNGGHSSSVEPSGLIRVLPPRSEPSSGINSPEGISPKQGLSPKQHLLLPLQQQQQQQQVPGERSRQLETSRAITDGDIDTFLPGELHGSVQSKPLSLNTRLKGRHCSNSLAASERLLVNRAEPPGRLSVNGAEHPEELLPKRSSSADLIGSFILRGVWLVDATNLERKTSFSRKKPVKLWQRKTVQTEALVQSEHAFLRKLVVHPSSVKRLFWDLLSMSLLSYDIMAIPFMGAFEPDMPDFMVWMTWGTLLFWTVDMPASVLTGISRGKQTILDPKVIAMRYATTWFPLDVLIVGLDWTLVLMPNSGEDSAVGGSAARLGRSLRSLRFVRTLRLIRVLKLKRIVQDIQDMINTEAVSICFRIATIISCLVVANHIVACGWYGIGSAQHLSWVSYNDMEGRSITFRYMTSLHWSLTQFTPASMEIYPVTVAERIYAVVILLFAMIAFSSFVSMLTASMTELRNISSDESRQFWLLRRYLRDWGVPRNVGMRIHHYLEYAYQRQRQRVQERDVRLLALLSEPLREELKHATFNQYLVIHPLFLHCGQSMKVFGRSLTSASLASGDTIFNCGEEATQLYFLTTGMVEYLLGELALPDPSTQLPDATPQGLEKSVSAASARSKQCEGLPPEYVCEGQWVAEPVLWTQWVHLGDMVAINETQVVTIDAATFGDAVQANKVLWESIQGYARKFIALLNEQDAEDLTDLAHNLFLPEDAITPSDFDAGIEEQEDDEPDNTMRACLKRVLTRSLTFGSWRKPPDSALSRRGSGSFTPVVAH